MKAFRVFGLMVAFVLLACLRASAQPQESGYTVTSTAWTVKAIQERKAKENSSIWRDGEMVRASVKPEKLEPSDPLRAATGADMFAYFKTDVLPGLTVIAHDGDAHTTAYDMLCDFVTVTRA